MVRELGVVGGVHDVLPSVRSQPRRVALTGRSGRLPSVGQFLRMVLRAVTPSDSRNRRESSTRVGDAGRAWFGSCVRRCRCGRRLLMASYGGARGAVTSASPAGAVKTIVPSGNC